MDGNQRWSKKNNKKIEEGYLAGFNNLEKIINYCLEINIKYITVFALSSENLKRNSSYVIFQTIRKIYKKLLKDLNNKKVNINIIGEKKNLPEDILKIFNEPYGSKDLKDKLINRVKDLYKKASKGSDRKKNILKEITLRLDKLPTRTLPKRVNTNQIITINSVANYLSGKIKGSTIQSDTKDSNSIYIKFGKNDQHHVHIYKNVKLVISIRIAFNSFENFELRYDHDNQKLCNAFNFRATHLHFFRPFQK